MAVRFEATGDRLERTTNIPPAGFTFMCWAYHVASFGDANAWQNIFHRGDTSTTEHYMATNIGVLTINGGGTGSTLTTTTWYHLAIYMADGTQLLYLNGVVDINTTAAVSGTINRFSFGASSWWTDQVWRGRLAAIKVWRAQLTQEEIINEARCYMPLRTTNIDTFLPCVGPTVAQNVVDMSGNGYDMTAVGAATIEDGPPIPWRLGRRRRLPLAMTDLATPVIGMPRAQVVLQAVHRASVY